ncbi:MAG: FtsX-like permease family protein [Sphingobacteriales bacterium]|nr:FtsX-like permease family protein [Sphingobacteriales bacterium]
MIKHYLLVAIRTLTRNKAFTAINLLGLALSLSCSLLIVLWVQDERSVDAFHKNGKDLYQVYERQYFDGKVEGNYFTQGLLADELKRTIPEIKYTVGMDYASAPGTLNTLKAGEKVNKMQGFYTGADFFKMFSYPLISGNIENALNTPDGIAISRKMADQFFGGAEKAMSKTILYENRENLQVTAVFENLPSKSSQQFDFLRSWLAFVKENNWVNNWGNTSPSTVVQLRPDADPVVAEAKIKDFIQKYIPKTESSYTELGLQPYSEKYLNATFKDGKIDGGRIEYVKIFSMVAVFILLISCINFMNLSTARAAKRAKEVGVRKVVGAARSMLAIQFIVEALLLTFFSVMLAVLLVIVFLPAFNNLTGKYLFLPFEQPVFWASLLCLLLITGFIAGSYPALLLSSLNPIKVLKGSLTFSAGAASLRRGLVVFQFSLSIIFIIGMIVTYRQMDYIQSKNLGYDRENLIYIPLEGELIKKYDLFTQEAGNMPGIITISQMRENPTLIGHHIGGVGWPGKDPNLTTSFANTAVEYDFVKTMNLKLKEGREFSKEFKADSTNYLLNETAVKKMGFQNAVGKRVSWGNKAGEVVGVLKDFHFNSMHQTIEPLIIRLDTKKQWGTILVRTEKGKTKEALVNLQKVCKSINPSFPFTYQFSDQEYTKLYKSEQVVSQLSNYFAFLAIFISCLGLLGLAMFTARQRIKEIGVRKVLGASVTDIVTLLSTSFLKPVALAIVIAFPISWYAINKWLQGFAYKIDIEWWIFAIAGLLTITIALLTVGYQAIKAALGNPVKSLRIE